MSFGGFHYTFTPAGHSGLKDYLRMAAEAGSPFALIYSVMEGGPSVDAEAVSPKTITVFRWTDGGDDPEIQGDPIEAARRQFAKALPIFRKNPKFTYFTCTNELNPAQGDPGANQWAAAYYLELLHLADANGLRFVWGNWSAGCPDYPDWSYYQDVIRYSANPQHPHALGLHEYGLAAPATPTAPEGSMRAGIVAETVLRYRRAYQQFREQGWGQSPLIISECAPGNHMHGDTPDNRLDIEMYDQAMIEDYVAGLPILGFAVYNWGGAEAGPFSKFIPWFTGHVRTHPTPHIAPPPTDLFFRYEVVHVPEAIAPDLSVWLDAHGLTYTPTVE